MDFRESELHPPLKFMILDQIIKTSAKSTPRFASKIKQSIWNIKCSANVRIPHLFSSPLSRPLECLGSLFSQGTKASWQSCPLLQSQTDACFLVSVWPTDTSEGWVLSLLFFLIFQEVVS